MNIGFTGTQRGMTEYQKLILKDFLQLYLEYEERWLLHGDCIGADDQAVRIARELGYGIWSFPPMNSSKRAFNERGREEFPQPYLVRNHNIVKNSDIMVATPGEDTEQLRSGTWATIRYARKIERHVFVVYPTHT